MEEIKKYRCCTSSKNKPVKAKNAKEAREKLHCKECLGESVPAFFIDNCGYLEEVS